MGIEKPYEMERGGLGAAPGRPSAVSVEDRLASMVRATDHGVELAGQALEVPVPAERDAIAVHLRGLLATRMRERRPHADDATWARLADLAGSLAAERRVLDADLERTLLRTVDGL